MSAKSAAALPTLEPQHIQLISASAIAPEVGAARGYRTVRSKAELQRLGFGRTQQLVPGLLIPIFDVTGRIALHQFRPDSPRLRRGKRVKYETPVGSRMVLDVPPAVREKLADPAVPLVITEGVRKADAAVSTGLFCIDLLGVWNWRGTNDHGGKTVLPDWESIALNDRQVFIVFDSDVMTKAGVHTALVRLKAFLESRGAHVKVIYLPCGDGGGKVGLDDFLAAGRGYEDLLALASTELRPLPTLPHDSASHSDYCLTPTGIVWMRPSREGVIPTPLTNFTARIVTQIIEDDGTGEKCLFEIEATLGQLSRRFTIPSSQYAGMNWPTEHLGAVAIVYPGFGLRDHARAAIQLLSGDVASRRIYGHIGWRKIDGEWSYLHAGGAIGAEGLVKDLEVSLPGQLVRFRLPAPPEGEELRTAIRSSLAVLDVAADRTTVPVYASTWRSVLGPADFSVHLAGPTGEGKTELAALIQQHWGPQLDARNLPGSWLSTGNALERLASLARDAVLVVDDFAPAGNRQDVGRAHREADRFLRAQGNRAGRQRLGPDATLQEGTPPAGLTISTGEDIPRGQSLRSRLLVLEHGPDGLDWKKLSQCQCDASSGLYSKCMSAYLRWLAARYEKVHRELPAEVARLRDATSRAGQHRRTSDTTANLAVGLHLFVRFTVETGALTSSEARELRDRCWSAFDAAATTQAHHQAASEPAGRFLELLSAAVASGRAHVAAPGGGAPAHAEAWGWRQERGDWRPMGDRVGWVDDDHLYLEPEAAYAAAQRVAGEGGDTLTVGTKTLHKRLHERGILASTSAGRDTLTVRRTLEGARRNVLHLNARALRASEPDQPTQHADHAVELLDTVWTDLGSGSEEPAQQPTHVSAQPEAGTHTSGQVGQISQSNDAPLAEQTPATSEEVPRRCFACHRARFWRSRGGGVVCAHCSPPAAANLVAEWIDEKQTP
jgi:hypothetical protein